MSDEAKKLMGFYPKIFFACHTRHVRDPKTETVLTAKQASILDHLDLQVPLSLNRLASHMGVTAATMSIAVDKLVAGGYVHRERSTEDRRQILLRLTIEGKELSEAHSVLDAERVTGMLQYLSPEERKHGLEGLALLAKASEQFLADHGAGWNDLKHEN